MESLNREHRVGKNCCLVEFRVVDQHLLAIGTRTLITGCCQVGQQVGERGANSSDEVGPESRSDGICRGYYATGIVVQEDERDVMPVLRKSAATRRGCFREEESGETVTFTSTLSMWPPIFAVSWRTTGSRDAKPVPWRCTAPRLSHSSNRTVGSSGAPSRSARSSNFTTLFPSMPSVTHRHTRDASGSNSALRSAFSKRAVLTAPHATSRSTWTSTSVVPA